MNPEHLTADELAAALADTTPQPGDSTALLVTKLLLAFQADP